MTVILGLIVFLLVLSITFYNSLIGNRNQVMNAFSAMMERILQLNDQSEDTVLLSFLDSKIFIAFPLSKNYFELPVYDSLLTSNLLEKDLSIIRFMHDIVHEMDLNTVIWGKE